MTQSKLDTIIRRLSNIVVIFMLLVIIIPTLFVGYRLVKGVIFPKVDKSQVSTVNGQTGEREYLSLGSFSKIQGTQFLVASLGATRSFRDAYYESYSNHGENTRNYLFYNIVSKKSRWLFRNNSALIVHSHELLKDPVVKVKGVERDWSNNRNIYRDSEASVISLIYEAVLADSNHDGRLNEDDTRALLYFNLSSETVLSLLEDIDNVLGLEQTSTQEVLVFYTNERKNYVVYVNPMTGEIGQRSELAAIQAQE